MPDRDPFVLGLRAILDAKPELKPAPLGVAAGLSNSTLRKLFAGEIQSLSVANAERVAREAGYDLSTVVALGEHGRGPDIIRLALAIAAAQPAVREKVDAYLEVALLETAQKANPVPASTSSTTRGPDHPPSSPTSS